MKKDLITFLEKHLGEIECGWESSDGHYQVVRFNEVPFKGAVTYTTIGLNRYVSLNVSMEIPLSQELVIVSKKEFGERNIPAIIMQVADQVIASGQILRNGELIGPHGDIFEDTVMKAIYVTSPVYFNDDFFVCREEPDREIVMAWLIPVTLEEASYINLYGGEKFEDLLVSHDPDLTDFNRESIV